MTSEYEKRRQLRLRENAKLLDGLGLERERLAGRMATAAPANAARKRTAPRPPRAAPAKRKDTTPRVSRRLAGGAPELAHGLDEEAAARATSRDGSSGGDDEDDDDDGNSSDEQALLARWASVRLARRRCSNAAADGEDPRTRRLFLVPTGPPGMNDHTLDKPVEGLDSHLWGFSEGLMTRIFCHLRVGDVLLMTSQGSGTFNRVARVRDKRVVSKATADQYWSRIDYTMGGQRRSNVGFPLLVPLDAPRTVDWSKQEVMRLLGYRDRLQSSRWIAPPKSSAPGAQAVMSRCLATLELPPELTKEEVAAQALLDGGATAA